MYKILALALCVCLLSSCVYTSANIIKLRGDNIKGTWLANPINITGENVILTLYREMTMSWGEIKHKFAKRIKIINEREHGDIEVGE